MANRILMNSQGMKISKPGVNVLAASPEQLLFDSDFGGITVGARGSVYIGGFGDYWIGLPQWFPDTALIMVEAAGHVSGGCRTVGETRHVSTFFSWFWSRWSVSIANNTSLLIRHTNYNTPFGMPAPAGPGFPYIVNYAVLDA